MLTARKCKDIEKNWETWLCHTLALVSLIYLSVNVSETLFSSVMITVCNKTQYVQGK